MKNYYFDHAATSFPKAPFVGAAMAEYIDSVGVNINRSTYASATDAALRVLETRDLLCEMFHFSDPTHVIFTPGQTHGLNYVLKGFLKSGDRVITSSMEHNAVMRPLVQMGIDFDRIPCDETGRMKPEDLVPLIKPNTRLVIMAHGSNVSGAVQDAAAVGKLCKEHGIAFALDAA